MACAMPDRKPSDTLTPCRSASDRTFSVHRASETIAGSATGINIYMSKKTNEVCPSKWKDEGDKTLVKPGAEMVGRVHEALHT